MIPGNLIRTRTVDAGNGPARLVLRDLVPAYPQSSGRSGVYGKGEQSFSLQDRLCFTGVSGRGKTTFFRCISGASVAGSGDLCWHLSGNLAGGRHSSLLRAMTLSLIPQDFALILHWSGWKNLDLAFRVPGGADPAPSERVRWSTMAVRLGLENLLERPAVTLSRGEQQRLAILRALVRPYRLLVADEPFSHLDRNRAADARALMEEESFRQGAGMWILDLSHPGGAMEEVPL